MYQWRIGYRLRNGSELVGLYEGPENDSVSVMKKLINGKGNDFTSHYGLDKDHMIGVKLDEIVAFEICKWEV